MSLRDDAIKAIDRAIYEVFIASDGNPAIRGPLELTGQRALDALVSFLREETAHWQFTVSPMSAGQAELFLSLLAEEE